MIADRGELLEIISSGNKGDDNIGDWGGDSISDERDMVGDSFWERNADNVVVVVVVVVNACWKLHQMKKMSWLSLFGTFRCIRGVILFCKWTIRFFRLTLLFVTFLSFRLWRLRFAFCSFLRRRIPRACCLAVIGIISLGGDDVSPKRTSFLSPWILIYKIIKFIIKHCKQQQPKKLLVHDVRS
jgi:hypothetical protein